MQILVTGGLGYIGSHTSVLLLEKGYKNVVVSDRTFTRLNTWLSKQGFTVEKVPYSEISKQEGLLRCSTLPLVRDK